MKPLYKGALIAGGYVICFLLASAIVAVRVATTNQADQQAAGGMYAFGDISLFVLVFGFSSLLPTGALLYILRPYPAFWRILSGLGVLLALTSLVAALLFILGQHGYPPSFPRMAGISVLWILMTPILAMASLVCAAVAPSRSPRLALFAASVIQGVVAVVAGIIFYMHMPG